MEPLEREHSLDSQLQEICRTRGRGLVRISRRYAHSPYTITENDQNSSNSVRDGSVGGPVRVLPIRHVLSVRLLRPGVRLCMRHPLVPDLLLQLSSEEVLSTDRNPTGAAAPAAGTSSHRGDYGRSRPRPPAAVQEAFVAGEVLVVPEGSPEQLSRAGRGRGWSRPRGQSVRRRIPHRRLGPIDPRDEVVARVVVSDIPVPPNSYQVHLARVPSTRQQPPNDEGRS